jgi:superfamily I DNA/RNA helicase
LAEPQRKLLWEIFANVRKELEAQQFLTVARMFQQLTESISEGRPSPYDFAIVDEAQDIGVPELRFFAAFGAVRPDALFFSGDLGQRIFQPPFSWKSLGVDIRGRSSTLRVNYRTSHQIRMQADRLLPAVVTDVDGNAEQRGGAISAFDGPEPVVTVYPSAQEETLAVAAWLKSRIAEGRQPHDLAVIVRSKDQFERASEAARKAGIAAASLVDNVETKKDHASILTMHVAKGLEYPAVAVIACDDEILPSQERISAVTDDSDLEEVYNTERHLLYVACTRARDHLFVSGVEPASEFLDDLITTAEAKK